MKAKPIIYESEDMFRSELKAILNLNHELCLLANKIHWEKFEKEFENYFPAGKGKPALAARLVVGVLYLKYAFGVSDEEVVARWSENPYWQYFCGEQYFRHEIPFHSTSLVKWRKRLGEEGCQKLLKEVIEVGLETETIKEKDLNKVTVDTTVQEKAITFPTDGKLYHQARVLLVKEAKSQGMDLRQTYGRLGKKALFRGNRYAAAQHLKKAHKEFKRIKRYLGCVYRDIQRQLEKRPELQPAFQDLLGKANRLLTQTKSDHNKLYSLHEPEVECIAKGKARCRYEFGTKTSIAVTHKSNFVVGMKACPGNPYDGHTLVDALDQVQDLTGVRPLKAYVDLGYRGHREKTTEVHLARTKNALKTYALRREMRRRSAIEPIIGHLKQNPLFSRNHLKGQLGDRLNALLCGAGYDLRLILKKLRLFCLPIFWYFRRFFYRLVFFFETFFGFDPS